jgi:hypothetical protein
MAIEPTLSTFLNSIRDIGWFSHAGEPCATARVTESIQTGWDREGKRMLEVWEPRTRALEAQAQNHLGDQAIDRIFSEVSEAVDERLYKGLCDYLDRKYRGNHESQLRQRSVDEGLYPEVMDSVKRDLCWAAIESVLGTPDLFTNLLDLYRQGRWPCSWDGEYPAGNPVVL